jgi:hypothetical protein
MILHFYVLGFGMKNWVLFYTYGTGAVTLKWNMGILLTKVTHGVCDPKELKATTSCGHIPASVMDGETLDYLREDQDTK